jgi:hypothetical protein
MEVGDGRIGVYIMRTKAESLKQKTPSNLLEHGSCSLLTH